MKYQNAIELLNYLGTYEKETGDSNLLNFAVWLTEKASGKQETQIFDINLEQQNGHSFSGSVAASISILYQHAKHYSKTALKDSPLVGVNDFIFLITLMEKGDMRKKEIIDYNYLDFSPGMEVIRRLIRNGLLDEFDDPNDGRSKRVHITDKGKEIVNTVYPEMIKATSLIDGNLSEHEKITIINLFQKLMNFHHAIWHQSFGRDLDGISKKYLPVKSV